MLFKGLTLSLSKGWIGFRGCRVVIYLFQSFVIGFNFAKFNQIFSIIRGYVKTRWRVMKNGWIALLLIE